MISARHQGQWGRAPLRRLVTFVNEKRAATPDDTFVGLEHVESWTGRAEVHHPPPGTGVAVRFEAGDVLFGRLRPYLAKAFLADSPGLASTEFLVMRPRLVTARFLLNVVLSSPFVHAMVGEAYGAKMPRVDVDSLGVFDVAYPLDPAEQERVADLLDAELAPLDVARRDTEACLALCQERALVTAANEIAALSATSRMVELRRVLRKVEQGWSPQAEERTADEGEWGVLKLSAVKRGVFTSSEHKVLPENLRPRPRIEVRDGDLLVTRANTLATVGDACVVRAPQGRLMMSDLMYRLVHEPERVDVDYLCLWLLSGHARQQIEADARGTSLSMVKVSQDLLRRWTLPLPALEVQRAMVRRVTSAQDATRSIVADCQRSLALLAEKRAILVTQAVSGALHAVPSTIPSPRAKAA